ncbi:MAG: hypothetical protein JXL97_02370 [Bacteroidales bacterium]|nr:hypothetical protein [Bacteroidales bacterium]
MDLYINTQTIIIAVVALIAIILLVKLFKKILRTILILLVVAGLAFYIFAYSNIFSGPGSHKKYSIENLKEKFCSDMQTQKDSVKCELIITPIYNDMKSTYTDEELLALEENPIGYFKALNQAIKRNKKDILQNLAKNKQEDLWQNFIQDINNEQLAVTNDK